MLILLIHFHIKKYICYKIEEKYSKKYVKFRDIVIIYQHLWEIRWHGYWPIITRAPGERALGGDRW